MQSMCAGGALVSSIELEIDGPPNQIIWNGTRSRSHRESVSDCHIHPLCVLCCMFEEL